MIIEQTINLTEDSNAVWELVSTIESVAECIPGIEEITVIEADEKYKVVANEKVGPFKVSFPMDLEVEELSQPVMRINATGQDKYTKTYVIVKLVVNIEPNATSDGTDLKIHADLQMKGKLATLGQGMINRKFTSKVKEFTKNLTAVLEGGKQDARSF